MHWKYQISGSMVSGYFGALAGVSLFDADIVTKLLNSLFGACVLGGITAGKLLNEKAERERRGR